ncbi:MAG: YeiH family protein [Thermotogota bacterium]
MKKNIPGLLLVIVISLLSMFLNSTIFDYIETLTIGIIISILIKNIFSLNISFNHGINYSLKNILKIGIVLLGVKLNFALIYDLGWKIFILVSFVIIFALIFSNYLGKKLGLNKKISTLLGVGSSICGASAIVAMSSVIDSDENDTTISVAVISLLGALGVILFSFFSYLINFSDLEFGIWSGSSLQGVAHALAAAGARGADSLSLEIGTLVKMSRVALLAPVALLISFTFKKKSLNSKNKQVKFPMYVIWFLSVGLVVSVINYFSLFPLSFSFGNNYVDIINILKSVSSFFILMGMVSMGLKVDLKEFKKSGTNSLIVGILTFLSISTISFIYISLFI